MTLQERIAKLEEAALNPRKAIMNSMKETGKEAVGSYPIYTPEEIIYAGGFLPVGCWGGKIEFKESEAYYQGFCCSIIKSNLEIGRRGGYDFLKAMFIPSFCDTLKCTIENFKVGVPQVPVIPCIYPQNRWSTGSCDYLVAELKRIRTALEKATMSLIPENKIEEAFELYEDYRAIMREFVAVAANYPRTINAKARHLIIKAAQFMDKAIYKEEVKAITEELKKLPEEKAESFKVVTTGLIGEPVEVLEIFDENGISIAADDVAQESRQFRVKARTTGSVWERMAYRTLDQKGDTFFAEKKLSKGEMLIDMVKQSGAEALVVIMMKFCDPEEFQYPVYKRQFEEAGIPLLYIEIDQQMDSFEQLRTRIQSFAEMV